MNCRTGTTLCTIVAPNANINIGVKNVTQNPVIKSANVSTVLFIINTSLKSCCIFHKKVVPFREFLDGEKNGGRISPLRTGASWVTNGNPCMLPLNTIRVVNSTITDSPLGDRNIMRMVHPLKYQLACCSPTP